MASIAPAQRSFHNPVQQDTAVLVETVEESGGVRSVFDVEVSPGGGNELHRHLTYAEHFTVLEGTLTVEVEGEVRHLGPGEQATAPIASSHRWANETDEPLTFRVELSPGHRGFEKALQVAYGLARDGETDKKGMPRNLLVLGLLGEWSDVRLVGPMALLAPLTRLLAAIARRRGLDAKLTERYVEF